jgi:hypothetical protein
MRMWFDGGSYLYDRERESARARERERERERQTDRQTERQTDRHTHLHCEPRRRMKLTQSVSSHSNF